MYITPLPTPVPQRGMPESIFSPAADAFMAAFPLLASQIDALGVMMQAWANQVAADAAIATGAATTATSAPGTSASTNSSSMSIGTGARTCTVQPGKLLVPGMTIVAAHTAAPNNQMIGVVQSYNSTTGVLDFQSNSTSGSGTYSDWTIAVVPAGTVGIPFNTASISDLWLGAEAQKIITPAVLAGAAEPQLFTESATIIFDLAAGWNWYGPLTATRTIGKPVNAQAGITYTFDFINGGAGLATWDSCFDFGDFGLPTLSSVNGKRDSVTARCYDDTVGAPKFRCGYSKAA